MFQKLIGLVLDLQLLHEFFQFGIYIGTNCNGLVQPQLFEEKGIELKLSLEALDKLFLVVDHFLFVF